MRLSEAVQLLSRRLGVKAGRVAAIANRLQHAGRLPLADAKRTPPELSDAEFALLMLAVLAENGVASAPARAVELAETGLDDAITAVLRGQAQPGDMIVKAGGASATFNGQHAVFGNPADDGFARFATGPTLAAIAAEAQGASPDAADAMAAIAKIRNH